MPKETPTSGDIRHGFIYERVPHITLKSIANNAEIDVIWERFQAELEPLRAELNAALKKSWEEWEIHREADAKWTPRKTSRLGCLVVIPSLDRRSGSERWGFSRDFSTPKSGCGN